MCLAVVVSLLVSANPYLVEARRAVEQLQYPRARQQLELAMAVTTSTRDERRELANLSALVFAAEGKLQQAEVAYESLLAADPSAPGPIDGPPRLRDAFRRVKERLYPPGVVTLSDRPSPDGRVVVALGDPWSAVVTVLLLEDEGRGFVGTPMVVDEAGLATATLKSTTVAWYVEATDAKQAVRASLGSAYAPRLVQRPVTTLSERAVPQPSVVSSHPRWPAVVSTVVTVALIASSAIAAGLGADASARAGQATFADDTRRLDLEARAAFTAAWGLGIGAGVTAGLSIFLWVW